MKPTLRVGIIGCGVIAPTHAAAYCKNGQVALAWACDLIPERAQALAERFGGADTTADYRQVLADDRVDIVSVCTGHASHADICVEALAAGKHVLCEKALAVNQKDVDRMVAAAAQYPEQRFGAVFQHRFDAVHRYVKQLIENGALGDLLVASAKLMCLRAPSYYEKDAWRGTWAGEGGSVMINQAIHFSDLLLWIGGEVREVMGVYDNIAVGKTIETEDTAITMIRFESGAMGSIVATSSSHLNWHNALCFYGTEGAVELRNSRLHLVNFKDKDKEKTIRADLEACRDPELLADAREYYGSGHVGQIADFVEAVREGRDPFVTVLSAAKTVAVTLAAYAAHRRGGWVSV